MQSIQQVLSKQLASTYRVFERNIASHSQRKLIQIHKQIVLATIRLCYGYKNGSCLRKHIHGINRNPNLEKSDIKPIEWKRFIDDIASFWSTTKDEFLKFIKKANQFQPTIKFTAEISDSEATFLDTTIYKGKRFDETGILDVSTHFKPTEKFQYMHFKSCHPPTL